MGEWLRHRTFTYVLGAIFVVGCLSGPFALYLATQNNNSTPVTTPVRSADAGEFAALFISSWLRQEDVSFFNPNIAPSAANVAVGKVAAIQSTEAPDAGGRGFDVVVAAEIFRTDGTREGLGFYSVGVTSGTTDRSGLQIIAPPSRVAAPRLFGQFSTVVGAGQDPNQTPELAEPLNTFFGAYLVQAQDQTFEQRTSNLATFKDASFINVSPVNPAPYDLIEIVGINARPSPSTDDIRLVNVDIRAQNTSGTQDLTYSLLMSRDEDRWEVLDLLGSPPITWEGP